MRSVWNLTCYFFDTYQSLSDLMKALWLVVPPAFVLGVVALVLCYRLAIRKAVLEPQCKLLCLVHGEESGDLQIRWRGRTIEDVGKLLLPVDEAESAAGNSGEATKRDHCQE